MKMDLVLRELHRSENRLADELLKVAERHRAEHEIHHVGRDMARWSQEHAGELSEVAENYGLRLSAHKRDRPHVLGRVREKASTALGRRQEPSVLLILELRHLHRRSAGVSLDWELLGQGAQAVKDRELLALTKRCHPQTLRQMRWTNAMLKMLSPQVMAS